MPVLMAASQTQETTCFRIGPESDAALRYPLLNATDSVLPCPQLSRRTAPKSKSHKANLCPQFCAHCVGSLRPESRHAQDGIDLALCESLVSWRVEART